MSCRLGSRSIVQLRIILSSISLSFVLPALVSPPAVRTPANQGSIGVSVSLLRRITAMLCIEIQTRRIVVKNRTEVVTTPLIVICYTILLNQ
jgi:hypothetical protein